MAKKKFAVLCDTNIRGTMYKAGSIVVLEEKEGQSMKDSLDPATAACEYYETQHGAKPVDLTEVRQEENAKA